MNTDNNSSTESSESDILIKYQAKYYGDNEWYDCKLGAVTSKGISVLFEGYEDDGWQVPAMSHIAVFDVFFY